MSDLTRIIYVSRSTFKPCTGNSGIEPNVARILSESRRNNIKRGLVGVLYYGSGCFFQCLEGTAESIDHLYDSLQKDVRHKDLKVLSRYPIEKISFFDWSMKYVSIDQQVQKLLTQHGMKRFDPYQFNDALVDELVDTFHHVPEHLTPATVEQVAETLHEALEAQAARQRVNRTVTALIAIIMSLGLVFFANLAMQTA